MEQRIWTPRERTRKKNDKIITSESLESYMTNRHKNFFTDKQLEFMCNATKKYNIYCGATGAGKSFLAWYMIPMMIKTHCINEGEIFIIGNTQSTVERNILTPMRRIHGKKNVSSISSTRSTCTIYGRQVTILGGDKISQVERIRGANVQYVYGDEISGWSEEVFAMLSTRLRLPNSRFDGACNPGGPNHWLKKWIDRQLVSEEQMLYYSTTTINDAFFSANPEEDARIKREMKAAQGDPTSVNYRRYMNGEWAAAEGLIYKEFGSKYNSLLIDKKDIPKLSRLVIGVDFGGTKSDHAFVATGFSLEGRTIYALKSRKVKAEGRGPDELNNDYISFLREVEMEYGMKVDYTYADNAEPVLINGMKSALNKEGLKRTIFNAIKKPVNNRISAMIALIGSSRFFYTEDAETLKNALLEAQWNSKKDNDERLDDFTSDIDTLDAFEYTIERDINNLTKIY